MTTKIDLSTLGPRLKKLWRKFSGHLAFTAIVAVLLIYVLVVWRIGKLVTAEPPPEAVDSALAATSIPKIDQKIINQIQSLEQGNTEIHSLFNQARNNPFQE
jgi:hypothetical protein